MAKLKFKSLTIHRAPGFKNGLQAPELNDLARDINIIAGPNAAGKTTIARIIQQLIWPGNSALTEIDCNYILNNESWSVHIDPAVRIIQKEGIDTVPEGIPPGELQKVYMLALHELVGQEDKDLAGKILNASSGGYDLDLASTDLKYSDEIKKRSNISDALKAASGDLERIKKIHEDLKNDEQDLYHLENKKKEAEKSASLQNLYEKAIQYHLAKKDVSEAETLLKTFPEVLKDASGDELNRIEELGKDLDRELSEIEKAKDLISNEEEIIKELQLPEKAIEDNLLNELEERISGLTELEIAEKNIETEIKELETRENIARKSINNIRKIDKWKGIKLEDAGKLDHFFRETLTLIQKELSIRTEIERLENEEPELTDNQELFRKGITILGEWLKERNSSTGFSLWSIIALSIAGIFTALAIYFFGLYGFIGIIFIISILLYAILEKRNQNRITRQRFREEDFKKTGLKEPLNWESNGVTLRLEELITELSALTQAYAENKSKLERLKDLKNRHDNLNSQIEEMEKVREKLLEQLNAIPDFPKSAEETISGLYLFLEGIIKWQNAYIDLVSKKERKESINDRINSELKKCNDIFNVWKIEPVKDSTSAKSVFKVISQSENKRRYALKNISNQEILIKKSQERINQLKNRINVIYRQLRVDPENFNEIRRIMEQYPDYKEALKNKNSASLNLSIRENEMRSQPLFKEYETELGRSDLFDVQVKAGEYASKAKELEDLSERITKIKTLIEQKKKGSELEDALAKNKNAENELEELFVSNLSSLTGFLLTEYLKKETANQSRPKVLKRADEIFGLITKGRYKLKVTDDKGPVFRAFDNKQNLGLNLDELSTGTRIQLLIATRLAFVESIENDIQLPILADELLANSDDIRAEAIIEALTEISSRGRQVFYFTAQPDEVNKWSSYLANRNDISYKIILLGVHESEKNRYGIHEPSIDQINFTRDIPEPQNRNIHEYRKYLKIRPFDLITDTTSQLSISFLTDNVDLFYHCLLSGLSTWGQLNGFYEAGGKIKNLNDQLIGEMRNKTALLDYFQELYRQGRHHPVTIDVIAESGAVSERFMPAVKEKLDEVKGNPFELMEILLLIPRFRKESKEQLEEYFIEKGYIDDSPQLNEETLRLRLQVKAIDLGLSPKTAEKFLNNIMRQ